MDYGQGHKELPAEHFEASCLALVDDVAASKPEITMTKRDSVARRARVDRCRAGLDN